MEVHLENNEVVLSTADLDEVDDCGAQPDFEEDDDVSIPPEDDRADVEEDRGAAADDEEGLEFELLKEPPLSDAADAVSQRFARKGDHVKLHFIGTFVEGGASFCSSRARDKPFAFVLGDRGSSAAATLGSGAAAREGAVVVSGWEIALPRVPLGGVARCTLPPRFAFGKAGRGRYGWPGHVPPDTAVRYEFEVLAINGEYFVPRDGGAEDLKWRESGGGADPRRDALDSFGPSVESAAGGRGGGGGAKSRGGGRSKKSKGGRR